MFISDKAAAADGHGGARLVVDELQKVLGKPQRLGSSFDLYGDRPSEASPMTSILVIDGVVAP